MNSNSGLWGVGLTLAVAAWPGSGWADILFIDTNDQAGERSTMIDLARANGERVHFVKGDGPELDALLGKAERGEITFSSVVGSGHSTGFGFWGNERGVGHLFSPSLGGGSYAGATSYAARFPKALSKVRTFIGLGCYTGTKYNILTWQELFPNATVLAGFNGVGPSGGGSTKFLRQVFSTITAAQRRAGGSDALARKLGDDQRTLAGLKRTLATLASVKNTLGSFEVCNEFVDPKGGARTREALERDVEEGRAYQESVLVGERPVPADPHATSPLRIFYNDLQEFMGVADASASDELVALKEQTIRLIYFDNIKKAWARQYPEEIAATNLVLRPLEVPLPDGTTVQNTPREEIVPLLMALADTDPDEFVEGGASPEEAKAAVKFLQSTVAELVELNVPLSWID